MAAAAGKLKWTPVISCDTCQSPRDAWQVAALEPEHFLALRGPSDLRGRPFSPAHWTMHTRQLANIKRLAERHRAQARPDDTQQ
jgi:hypothetical protein